MSEKKFVITQKFEKVFTGDYEIGQTGEGAEHFDISWRVRIFPQSPDFTIDLDLFVDPRCRNWYIDSEIEWKLVSKTGIKHICKQEYQIEKDENPTLTFDWKIHGDCFIEDTLTVECHVTINEMGGFRKRLRNFEEKAMKDFSDFVLVVEDEKFYVLKLFLACQSTYFKTRFVENPLEPTTSQFSIDDVHADDFQVFLEVLYGEIAIDDETVVSLLNLAEKFDAPTVTQKCEHYLLLHDSNISLLNQLTLSIKYKMDKLKENCLADIQTAQDLQRISPIDVTQLESPVMAVLMEKALTLF
ncbi:hypothetical protein GCK72_007296 [Caenorhabditis remanei]|uniref:BTB domain-containing protein n=1 Tax=Caenorhabditis remanei TaxID=31234 RepID=A0A6A5HLI3_CAERE|nr:hypothetical protein GCK72_007296 [Caenorhabditis remanei]KAF1767337.1 hypothetical protein GCK72_007296 [Caenorhabditis remanei]